MIEPKINVTFEHIITDIDYYINDFLDNGILIFKRLNPTRQQEWDLMKLFGDKIGWFPNSTIKGEPRSPYLSLEDETHEMTFARQETQTRFPDQLFIDWHIESMEKTNYQTGALWHMRKFECSKDSGKTGFVNAQKMFENMSIEWKTFLQKCEVSSLTHTDKDGFYTDIEYMDSLSIRQAVVNHYTTLKPIFRLTISGKDVLRKFDNREPLEREIKLFEEIQEWTIKEITQNTSNQYWHRWDVGDTLIVDLSLMAHAVTGGFNLGERFFSRIWAHKYDF